MKATIWHNPNCGTSRKTLEILRESGADDEAVLDAMVANPALIERPVVETEKGVRLCRPQDRVREIL